MITKPELGQKLEETGALFVATGNEQKKNELRERAYWLERAIESEAPETVLERAFSLWSETQGKLGLEPFKNQPTDLSSASKAGTGALQPAVSTLWGVLYQEFSSGKNLDDPHFSEIFNRLPPSSQTRFVDATKNHIQTRAKDEEKNETDITQTVLKDEEQLLRLVEKAKEISAAQDQIVEQNSRKITEWLRYHQTEPRTQVAFEEVLYGPEAAKMFEAEQSEEIYKLFTMAKNNARLSEKREQTLADSFAIYEQNIMERFQMKPSEYVRIRNISIGTLLNAVSADPKQLLLIEKSAVRPDLLNIPDEEFKKRVRVARLVRAYVFGKELHHISVRQFFRGIVEKT
jgi:hypothetical protein